MVFLVALLLSFTTYANNPIQKELEALNIEALFSQQKQLADENQAALDIYNKNKDYDSLTYYEYKNKNDEDGNLNDSEQVLLSIKKSIESIENKFKIKGDWGKIRLKLEPETKFKEINLKYKYGF